MILGEILGPDILIVIGLLVLLFGGGQIPKLARSLGQAKREFEKGLGDSGDQSSKDSAAKEVLPTESAPKAITARDSSADPKP